MAEYSDYSFDIRINWIFLFGTNNCLIRALLCSHYELEAD